MSRRYGRGQKAKARAQIAQLTRQVDYWEGAYRRDVPMLEQGNREKAAALDDVATALGVNWIGLPPQFLADLAIEQAPDDRFMFDVDGDAVEMHIMRFGHQNAAQHHRVHFNFRLGNQLAASYAVSIATISHSPPERLAKIIGECMGKYAYRYLKELHRND